MSTEVKLSAREQAAFRAIAKHNAGDWWCYLSRIAEEEDMDHRVLRNAARALARKGLTKLVHCFDEATGLAHGSTYALTDEGRRLWEIRR